MKGQRERRGFKEFRVPLRSVSCWTRMNVHLCYLVSDEFRLRIKSLTYAKAGERDKLAQWNMKRGVHRRGYIQDEAKAGPGTSAH